MNKTANLFPWRSISVIQLNIGNPGNYDPPIAGNQDVEPYLFGKGADKQTIGMEFDALLRKNKLQY